MRVTCRLLPGMLVVVGIMCLSIPMVFANMRYLVSIRNRLNRLHRENELNDRQYYYIIAMANHKLLDAELLDHAMNFTVPPLNEEIAGHLRDWLEQEEDNDNMMKNAADLIRNLFRLGAGSSRSEGNYARQVDSAAKASYTKNGVVEFLARSTSFDTFYNGIWGFTKGAREYALQCGADGLHILDVTTADIILVQTIPMSGGEIWRDVATHDNYAYVAAQGGSSPDAWVVNLSELSGASAQAANSNPITTGNIKNIGEVDRGHTINVWNGLLFLNGAGGNTFGCRIFDLLPDPMMPKFLTTYSGGDCHDSYGQTIGQKDVLFSADGMTSKYRMLDITNIRKSEDIPRLGETPFFSGAYAHQNIVSEDGTKLFAFDEFNKFDIAVYDISILSIPKLLSTFQWSGEKTEGSSFVHNGMILGKYLLVAYYQAGFRVFDTSNPTQIEEVGKYETYRDPDGDGNFQNSVNGGYDGAWNVATLKSGKILISDSNYGTFVVKINDLSTPTPAPTIAGLPLTGSGSLAPTIAHKCAINMKVLMLEVKTDNQSTETRFKVSRRNKKKLTWKKTIIKGAKLGKNKVHTYFNCVNSKKQCYRLRVFDKGNNGIENGFIKISLDGKIVYNNKFTDGKKRFVKFGNCENKNRQ